MESERVRRGPKFHSRYPWRKWFSRDCFTLVRGVDYHYQTYVMSQMVRNAARRPRHGVQVSITQAEDGGSLTVTVTGRGGHQKSMIGGV